MSSLTNINVDMWDTGNVTSMKDMFATCTSLATHYICTDCLKLVRKNAHNNWPTTNIVICETCGKHTNSALVFDDEEFEILHTKIKLASV